MFSSKPFSRVVSNLSRVIFKTQVRAMQIIPIPANEDNYQYLIVDEVTNLAAIVDPVHVPSILSNVESRNVNLQAALVTHHHWDHAGGTGDLAASQVNSDFKIYAGDGQRVNAVNQILNDGDTLTIGQLKVKALSTPCHTSTHICYFVENEKNGEKAVFTGDTLFIGGCGRFFEGTAEQMHIALNNKLAQLPDETKVYCGHEYTVANLKFAKFIEPNNSHIENKLTWAEGERKFNRFTIPSTIGAEKTFNPFMRVNEASVQNKTGTTNPVETMHKLRELKNNFRG